MTHPRIGTEGMADGSDGVSDFPLLDAMALAAAGADLVAIHSGGGGYSGWMQSAGVTVVADGSDGAAERLAGTLNADTALGVIRHARAGYAEALDTIDRDATSRSGCITWFNSQPTNQRSQPNARADTN
jgi:urocanate hydratase